MRLPGTFPLVVLSLALLLATPVLGAYFGPFYVHGTSGNDIGNNGSFNSPFATIQKGVTRLASGTNVTSATCFVAPGIYPGNILAISNKNAGFMTIVRLSNVTPIISAGANGIILSNTRNMIFRGFRVKAQTANGVLVRGGSRNNTIDSFSISNCQNGIRLTGTAVSNYLLRTEAYRSPTSGIILTGGASRNIIRFCSIRSNVQPGIEIQVNSRSNFISRNYILSNYGAANAAVNVAGAYSVICSNIIAWNIQRGVGTTTGGDNCLMFRNAIFRNTGNGIDNFNTANDRIYNNTLVSNNQGIYLDNAATPVYFLNNIIVNSTLWGVTDGTAPTTHLIAYNCASNNPSGDYDGNLTLGSGNIYRNPQFLSFDIYSTNFLALADISPCIDAGTNFGLTYRGRRPDIGWKEFDYQGPFYVDDSSGADTNYGTFRRPFRTIQHGVERIWPATNLTSGTCFVFPGTYAESVLVRSNRNPDFMTLSALSNRLPLIQGGPSGFGIALSNVRRVLVSGFNIRNYTTGPGFRFGNKAVANNLLNSRVSNCQTGIEFRLQALSNTADGCWFARNTADGAVFAASSRFNEVRTSRIMRNAGWGVNLNDTTCGSNRIAANFILTNTGDGVYTTIKGAVIISNVIVNNSGMGIEVPNLGGSGFIGWNAVYYNQDDGISITTAQIWTVIHNTIISNCYTIFGSGIALANDLPETKVVNDIVAGTKLASASGISGPNGGGVYYCNFDDSYNNGTGAPDVNYRKVDTGYAYQLQVDPLLLYTDDIYSPAFLTLQAGSPCIDTGTNQFYPFFGGAPDMGWKEYSYSGPFFVDDNSGNDANEGAFTSPFRTIQRAAARLSSGSFVTFSTCFIFPGTYPEQVEIRSNRFASRGYVVFTALSNTQPVITGQGNSNTAFFITNASKLVFKNLNIRSFTGPAFDISSASTNCLLSSLTIASCRNGIRLRNAAAGVTVSWVRVLRSSADAVLLTNSAAGNTVSRCVLHRNSGSGIRLASSGDNTASFNYCLTNNQPNMAGIFVESGTPAVVSNLLQANYYGVNLGPAVTSCTLLRNGIDHSLNSGLQVAANSSVFYHNTLVSNSLSAGNGIGLAAGTVANRFVNNLVAHSRNGYGLYCNGPVSIVIKSNDLFQNATGSYSADCIADLDGTNNLNPLISVYDVYDRNYLTPSLSTALVDKGAFLGYPYYGNRPDPGWKEVANTGPFYVDDTSGVDGPTNGSFAKPFRTIQYAVDKLRRAVDVTVASAYVFPGVYQERVLIKSNLNPLMGVVNLSNTLPVLNGNGVSNNGFAFTNCRNVFLSGFRVGRFTANGIVLRSGSVGITVDNCQATNCGNGIAVIGNATNNDIVSGRVFRNSASGILIDGGSGTMFPVNNMVRLCTVRSNKGGGVKLQNNANDNVISGNYILSNTGAGFANGNTTGVQFNSIWSNVVAYNTLEGIYCTTVNNSIFRNAVYHNMTDGINTSVGTPGNLVYHNSIVSNSITGGNAGIRVTAAGYTTILNNIAVDSRTTGYGMYKGAGGAYNGLIAFNDVTNNATANYNNLTPGPGSVNFIPQFLSYDIFSSNFLVLSTNSRCIDAGTNLGLWDYNGGAPDMGWKESMLDNTGPFYADDTSGYDYSAGTFDRPFRTIQRGFNRMAPGINVSSATCFVFPGVYSENVEIDQNLNPGYMTLIRLTNTKGPWMSNTAGHGLLLTNAAARVWIEGIRFKRYPQFVRIRGADNNVFRSNLFQRPAAGQGFLLTDGANDNLLCNNYFATQAFQPLVDIDSCSNNTLESNLFVGTQYNQILIENASEGNRVVRNNFRGLNSGQWGAFRFYNLSLVNSCLSNTFAGYANPIFLERATNQIVAYNFASNQSTGVYCGPRSVRNLILANRIVSNSANGIDCPTNTANSILSNRIAGANVGILLNARCVSNFVSGNSVRYAVLAGLQVGLNARQNLLSGNRIISNTAGIGIQSIGTNTMIRSNLVAFCPTGIRLENTSSTLSRNAVFASRAAGIALTAAASNSLIINNTAVSNGTNITGPRGLKRAVFVNNNVAFSRLRYGFAFSNTPPATTLFRFNNAWSNKATNYKFCTPGNGSRTNDPLFLSYDHTSIKFLWPSSSSLILNKGTNWQPYASAASVVSNADPGWKELRGPGPLLLVSPVSGSFVATNRPLLVWQIAGDNGQGVSNYLVQVSTNPSFNGTLQTNWNSSATSTNWQVASALSTDLYYWRVKAVDRIGYPGDWSTVWNFMIDTNAPLAPVLVSPASNSAVTTNRPLFVWRKSTDVGSGVSNYRVVVSTNAGFTGSVLTNFTADSSVTNMQFGSTFPFDVYYWRVQAFDRMGNGSPWSIIRPFTVIYDVVPPPVPILVSPASNSTATTNRPTFKWRKAIDTGIGTTNYLFQIAADSGFASIEQTNRLAGALTTNWWIATALANGLHYWRVYAFDKAGNSSVSVVWPLTVSVAGASPGLYIAKSVSNSVIPGPYARLVPGSAVTFRIWYSNSSAGAAASQAFIYDRWYATNYLFRTNVQVPAGWTAVYSTNQNPTNYYSSSSYSATRPAFAKIRRIAWKKLSVSTGESGVIYYRVMIR